MQRILLIVIALCISLASSGALAGGAKKRVKLKDANATADGAKFDLGKALEVANLTGLAASVSPKKYSSICPAKITYTAVIHVDQPGTIQYAIHRSDGQVMPTKTLYFKPGELQKSVSYAWTIGKKSYSGWMAIKFSLGLPANSTEQFKESWFEAGKKSFEVSCFYHPPSSRENRAPERTYRNSPAPNRSAPSGSDSAPTRRQTR